MKRFSIFTCLICLILSSVLFSGCLSEVTDDSNSSVPVSENYAFSGEVVIFSVGNNIQITVMNDFVSYGDKLYMNFTIDESLLSRQDIPEYKLDAGKHIFLLYEYEHGNTSKEAIVTEATVFREGMSAVLYNGTVKEIRSGGADSRSFIQLNNSRGENIRFFHSSSLYCFGEIVPGMEVTICGDPIILTTDPGQGWAYAV